MCVWWVVQVSPRVVGCGAPTSRGFSEAKHPLAEAPGTQREARGTLQKANRKVASSASLGALQGATTGSAVSERPPLHVSGYLAWPVHLA